MSADMMRMMANNKIEVGQPNGQKRRFWVPFLILMLVGVGLLGWPEKAQATYWLLTCCDTTTTCTFVDPGFTCSCSTWPDLATCSSQPVNCSGLSVCSSSCLAACPAQCGSCGAPPPPPPLVTNCAAIPGQPDCSTMVGAGCFPAGSENCCNENSLSPPQAAGLCCHSGGSSGGNWEFTGPPGAAGPCAGSGFSPPAQCTCTSIPPPPPPPPSAQKCDTNPRQYQALLRASRRGQVTGPNNQFNNAASGPGDSAGLWGQAYDNSNSKGSFGIYTYTQGAMPTATALHYSGSPPAATHTGSVIPYAMIQVNDPTSDVLQSSIPFSMASNPHFTALINMTGITGPDSNAASVPSSWPMTIVGGPYRTSLTAFPSPNLVSLSANPPWTKSANLAVSPPQPCTGGACDTDQLTVPNPPALGAPDYGANPDQYTPYTLLNSTSPVTWGYITGVVEDASTVNTSNPVPLPGIAVSVINGTQYPSFEKVTDQNGTYLVLIPASGLVDIHFNDTAPSGNNTVNSHYYNPHYNSDTTSMASRAVVFPSNGSTIREPIVGLTPTVPTNLLTATITGQVTAAELSAPTGLVGVYLELRDNQGYVVDSTTTVTNGNYTFVGLPAGTFTVIPLLDRRQSANPPRRNVTIASTGGTATANFSVRGAPATLVVSAPTATYQPGSFVVVASTWVTSIGGTSTGLPPNINRTQGVTTYAVYTATLGSDNTATLKVAPGRAYNLVCWALSSSGAFTRVPGTGALPLNSGAVSNPQQSYTGACP